LHDRRRGRGARQLMVQVASGCSQRHRAQIGVSVRGFDQSFPPWAKDNAAEELQLSAQLLDKLLVLLDGLRMELCGLIERGLEVFNLLANRP
jgi:hypothetical protein